MHSGKDFWKNYMEGWFGSELINKWKENCKIQEIESYGRKINLEIYGNNDRKSPVIVFSHGIAGYARVLLPFVIPLFEKGYNFIVPDLQGYGYNRGMKGDFEWNAHVQNLADATLFARQNFDGKVILGGASMGGPLAYATSCFIPDAVDALVCWCLWDFSDRNFMLNETSTGRFTFIILPFLKVLSLLFPKTRIRTFKIISYDTLSGSEKFNELIKQDPQAGTWITLKGVVSLLTQSKPAILHEDYNKPVLVFQPGKDRMTPKYYIKKTFNALGSKKKKYIEPEDCEHFPVLYNEMKYYSLWADEVDVFLKSLC